MLAYLFIIAYLAGIYLQPGIKFPSIAPYRPVVILGLLTIVASILYLARRKGQPLIFDKQIKMFLIILAFIGVSVLGAYVKLNAYNHWVGFAKMVVFLFFLVNVVDSLSKFKGLIYALLIIHIFVAIDGLQGFYTTSGRGDQQGLQGVLRGFLGDSNDFALALNVILPYAYFLMPSTKRVSTRLFLVSCFVLFGVAIMFTFSRGGFVTLCAVLFYFLMKSQRKVQVIVTGGVLLVITLMVIPKSYWDRVQTITNYSQERTAQTRFWSWEAGWQMALDNPILGMGPGNFPTGYGRFYRPSEARAPNWYSAHSIYFQVMGELGFVGLGLFALLVFSVLRTQKGILKKTESEGVNGSEDTKFVIAASCAMQASLVGFLVGGIFLGAAYYPHLWYNAAFTQILASVTGVAIDRVRAIQPQRVEVSYQQG